MAGHAEASGKNRGHSAGGAVDDDRPGSAGEHRLDRQRQGRLLTDEPALGGGDRQPVSVRILKETDIAPARRNPRQEDRKVLLGRLGRVLKAAIRAAAFENQLAAERLEQRHGQPAPRAVAGIKPDPQPRVANPPYVNRPEHPFEVCRTAIDILPAAGYGSPRRCLGPFVGGEHAAAFIGGEHAAARPEELQPVVLRRVVTGGDLDSTRRRKRSHEQAHGRCRRHAPVEHVPAGGPQRLADATGPGGKPATKAEA